MLDPQTKYVIGSYSKGFIVAEFLDHESAQDTWFTILSAYKTSPFITMYTREEWEEKCPD